LVQGRRRGCGLLGGVVSVEMRRKQSELGSAES
jgi:hypothetical protein